MSIREQFVATKKYNGIALALMTLGALAIAGLYVTQGSKADEHQQARFWAALLHNSVYFLLVVNAAMFFICATTLAWGGWQMAFRRVPEAISAVVCADCPDYMKEVLVKYHKDEPVKGLNDKVKLGMNFAKVPKYYISTTNDYAVPYALQQQMIRSNGAVKKVYELPTSHLPFVVSPDKFIQLMKEIN